MATQSQFKLLEITSPTNKASSGDSSAVDLQGYLVNRRQMKFVFSLGTLNAGSVTCKMTECDTSGGTYTDMVGGGFTAASAIGMQEIHAKPTKRYIKVNYVVSGATTAIFVVYALAEKLQH